MEAATDVVIVTGSSGLIGSSLVRRLRDDYQVVEFDLKGNPVSPVETEFICVDVTSDESVDAALGRVRRVYGDRIASVVHLAAFYDFSGEPNRMYEQVTVRGTERLLRGLQDFDVEQFVFSSTMLVHRPVEPGGRISEDAPLRAEWAYPQSKVRTEQIVRDTRGDIHAVLLRIAGIYDDEGHSPPIANAVRRIYERRLTSHVYPADLAYGQAFLHLDDLLDALMAAVERRASLPDEVAMLVGEDQTIGYGEMQDLIGQLVHGKDWATFKVPQALAKAGARMRERNPAGEDPFEKPWMIEQSDDHYALDITRARELLGWEPKRSLRETLPKMIENLEADPVAWYAENGFPPPDDS